MLRNLTLAAMADDDMAALRPHLKEQAVASGQVLIPQGSRIEIVYFPATAGLMNAVTFSDGRSAETFAMGVEGVSGLAPFMADLPCAWSVEVKQEGIVISLPASRLRTRVNESPALRQLLLRRVSDYQAQAALGVACATLHRINNRLARLLLVHTDRLQSDRLRITQEDLAHLLGCQRTTVTASARELKARRIIRYLRGVIQILDRPALMDQACECYALQRSWVD